LEQLLNQDFNPQDIDFLIPQKYIEEEWPSFKVIIENIGYTLIDLHEHEFTNGKFKIAFADIEGLKKDCNIKPEEIDTVNDKGVNYKILNLQQYLLAYEYSSKDGYRKNKNNNKDFYKIKCIKQALSKH
jgi:hypothetical protein